jgi:hypothetical protein
MIARYDLREDTFGWTVFDIWTGKPVIVHDTPQVGLEIQDADELAEALTWLSDKGDREVRQ